MKKLLLFFLTSIAFVACTKDNEVTPADPVAAVSGTYDITRLQQGTAILNLPFTAGNQSISATLTATAGRVAGTVALSVTVRQAGAADDTQSLGEAEVRGSGTNLELYEGTTKVGTADGTNLTIDATDGGERIVIVAKKK